MARILVSGLNPAWQTVISLPHWMAGEVLRARESVSLASGKGINCARLLARLGHDVTLVQVLAGERGNRCMQACERAGIRSLHVWAEGETRQCLTLRDEARNEVTEVIEPFAVDYQEAWGRGLLRQVRDAGNFDALVVLGSAPNGWQGSFYRDLLRQVSADLKILDALQGLGWEDLREVSWVKVNAAEWSDFLGRHGAIPPAVEATCNRLITHGAQPARLEGGGCSPSYLILPGLQAVNPIGAGDTVTAGLTHHGLAGRDRQSAAIQALAMGAASCLEILPAHYQPEQALKIASLIRVETCIGEKYP